MEWLRDLGFLPVAGVLVTVGAVCLYVRNRRRTYRDAVERLRLLGVPNARMSAILGRATDAELDRFLRSPEPPVAFGRLLDGFARRGVWANGNDLDLLLWGAEEARQRAEHREEASFDVHVLQPLCFDSEKGREPLEVLPLWIRGHRLLALQLSAGQYRKGCELSWRRDDRKEFATLDSHDSQSPRVLWLSCRKGMSWEERRAEYRTKVRLGAYLLPAPIVSDVLARHLGSHDGSNRNRAKLDVERLAEEHCIHIQLQDISRRGARLVVLDATELEGRDFWLGLSPAWEQDLPEVLAPARILRRDKDGSIGLEFRGLTRETTEGLSQWIIALQRTERRSFASRLFGKERTAKA